MIICIPQICGFQTSFEFCLLHYLKNIRNGCVAVEVVSNNNYNVGNNDSKLEDTKKIATLTTKLETVLKILRRNQRINRIKMIVVAKKVGHYK